MDMNPHRQTDGSIAAQKCAYIHSKIHRHIHMGIYTHRQTDEINAAKGLISYIHTYIHIYIHTKCTEKGRAQTRSYGLDTIHTFIYIYTYETHRKRSCSDTQLWA
jgi:hypothetical protein